MKPVILLVLSLMPLILLAQDPAPTGILKGTIVNSATKDVLPGATVLILNTTRGAAADEQGAFILNALPAGSYSVAVHSVGFEKTISSDIIIRPGRITYVHAELHEQPVQTQEVVVSAGYFPKEAAAPLSVARLNTEEIRRAPGSAGDVSRILMALPGVAQVADNANDLMVRGGSPFENGFYVDQIPVPNINHFPVQGATGGPIGLLNVDFINNVSFYTGGFSALYGNRLSSILDISLREGNRDVVEGQIDMGMSGFGGVLEGPFTGKSGSWFLSARRSYLDFIVDAIGTGVAPRYGDLHAKAVIDLNSQHRLMVLDLVGMSSIAYTREEAMEAGQTVSGEYSGFQNTAGVTWRALWSPSWVSQTSLSYSLSRRKDTWYNLITSLKNRSADSYEGTATLRHVSLFQLSPLSKIEAGIEMIGMFNQYNNFYAPATNRVGNAVQGMVLDDRARMLTPGGFINILWNPAASVTASFGLRTDYQSRNDRLHLSPRLSATYRLDEQTAVNAAAGVFFQPLPLFLLIQNSANTSLKDPMALHAMIGVDRLLTEDTKLTIELYAKDYRNFPLNPDEPSLFLIDDGRMFSFFQHYDRIVDHGRARSYGVELLLQKKLAVDFYGMVSASYCRSQYRDYNGIWRNRLYDNRYLFNIIGGYKPGNTWEFSARWNYAGGVPYTPFDEAKSMLLQSGILDGARTNEERQPDYHSLNLRVDRRFLFQRTNLVVYLSLFNTYNRKNVAARVWDVVANQEKLLYQWSFLPVVGMEYEF